MIIGKISSFTKKASAFYGAKITQSSYDEHSDTYYARMTLYVKAALARKHLALNARVEDSTFVTTVLLIKNGKYRHGCFEVNSGGFYFHSEYVDTKDMLALWTACQGEGETVSHAR